jgi:hypothetical protein
MLTDYANYVSSEFTGKQRVRNFGIINITGFTSTGILVAVGTTTHFSAA